MFVLVAVANNVPVKVVEADNLGDIVAAKSKITEANDLFAKQIEKFHKQPASALSFEEYEGTKEEYEKYLVAFKQELDRLGNGMTLQQPTYFGYSLHIL